MMAVFKSSLLHFHVIYFIYYNDDCKPKLSLLFIMQTIRQFNRHIAVINHTRMQYGIVPSAMIRLI